MTQAKLLEVISKALHVSAEKLGPDLEFGSIPEWDSLNHVDLMMALEEAFSVEIDEDRMIELTSFEAIKTFIAENGTSS